MRQIFIYSIDMLLFLNRILKKIMENGDKVSCQLFESLYLEFTAGLRNHNKIFLDSTSSVS